MLAWFGGNTITLYLCPIVIILGTIREVKIYGHIYGLDHLFYFILLFNDYYSLLTAQKKPRVGSWDSITELLEKKKKKLKPPQTSIHKHFCKLEEHRISLLRHILYVLMWHSSKCWGINYWPLFSLAQGCHWESPGNNSRSLTHKMSMCRHPTSFVVCCLFLLGANNPAKAWGSEGRYGAGGGRWGW